MYFLESVSIGIWWNPEDKSRAEKNVTLPSWDSISSMSGNGYASWSVSSFIFLKSIMIRHFCFPEASVFFGTTQTDEL